MRENGFTLIELVAVLILIGLIGATAATRFFDNSGSTLMASRDDLVTALRLAQQLAMDTDQTITFQSTSATLAVLADGAFVTQGSVSYPLALPAGVSLTPVSTLSFNRLGETTATTFILAVDGRSINVDISTAGYAR